MLNHAIQIEREEIAALVHVIAGRRLTIDLTHNAKYVAGLDRLLPGRLRLVIEDHGRRTVGMKGGVL